MFASHLEEIIFLFSLPVQIEPGPYVASCTISNGAFLLDEAEGGTVYHPSTYGILSGDLYLYLPRSTSGPSGPGLHFFRQHNESEECCFQVTEHDATTHNIFGSVFPW